MALNPPAVRIERREQTELAALRLNLAPGWIAGGRDEALQYNGGGTTQHAQGAGADFNAAADLGTKIGVGSNHADFDEIAGRIRRHQSNALNFDRHRSNKCNDLASLDVGLIVAVNV